MGVQKPVLRAVLSFCQRHRETLALAQQQEVNPQEQEELDIESQLDALLARLDELEPDLLAGNDPEQSATPAQANPEVVPAATQLADGQMRAVAPTGAGDGQDDASPPPKDTAAQLDVMLGGQANDALDKAVQTAMDEPAAVDQAGQEVVCQTVAAQPQTDEPDRGDTATKLDDLMGQHVAHRIDEAQPEPAGLISPTESQHAGDPDMPVALQAATSSDDSGPLADQLQALLNTAESEPLVQSERVDVQPQSAAVNEGQLDAVDESVQGEPLSVEAIDQLLADEADDAVGEAFDVTEGAGVAVPLVAHAASEQDILDPQDNGDDDQVTTTPADWDHSAATDAQGSIAMHRPSGGEFGADASAVAWELDEQRGGRMPIAAEVGAQDRMSRVRHHIEGLGPKLVVCEKVLRQGCSVINRPVVGLLPPDWHDFVGYLGALNVLIGLVLILIGLI